MSKLVTRTCVPRNSWSMLLKKIKIKNIIFYNIVEKKLKSRGKTVLR